MWQSGAVASQLFCKRVERLLGFAFARDDTECPVCNFFTAGEPLIRPREKNGSCQTAFYHAIDVPTEHFGLFVLRMSDGVHAEFAQDKRMLAGEILQPQQITLEIVLVVQVNIKATKIGILRQQIFGWGISGVRKERVRIDRASDANQFLDKLNHSARAEPSRHRTGNLIAYEVTKDGRVPGVRLHCSANGVPDLFAGRSFTQELDMFF